MLHWTLLPNGLLRDLASAAADPARWPQPNSGSIQKREWLALGFNLQKSVEDVHGPRLRRPLTKFHGNQVQKLFAEGQGLWAAESLQEPIARLKENARVGAIVTDLLTVWDALSQVHSVVNTHPADLGKLAQAVRRFRNGMSVFEFDKPGGTPKPCLYRRKFYDHAIVDHLQEQAERLDSMGLSHAMTSSRYLEACNKYTKVYGRRLPGGGRDRESPMADPVFLILKHLFSHNFATRRAWYRRVQERRAAACPGAPEATEDGMAA